jgi:hypothetical protein
MKRLVYPILLIVLSLVSAAIFTTITAVALASYAKDDKNSNTIVVDSLSLSNESISYIK